MTEKFVFHGQTTFINRPRDTVIRDFQHSYVKGDGSAADDVNSELARLLELILDSGELDDGVKEEAAAAVDGLARDVAAGRASKLTLRGALEAVGEVVKGANDIAQPALGLIASVLRLVGAA
jgi:hypothetical protein